MAYAVLTGVVFSQESQIDHGIAAEAISIGQVVRRTSAGLIEVANAAAALTADMVGVALQTVTAGNPIQYAKPGAVLTVSGLTKGVAYYLGGGADEGKVGLFTDADTANVFATLVGLARSATQFQIIGIYSGAELV